MFMGNVWREEKKKYTQKNTLPIVLYQRYNQKNFLKAGKSFKLRNVILISSNYGRCFDEN